MRVRTVVPIGSGDARKAVARFGKSPRTSAVPLLGPNEYGTPAWHLARRSMIGASEMAAVLGRSPFASPFSLWWSKQEGWELEPSLTLRLGHELEPIIAKLFAESRPDAIVGRPNASLWRSPIVEWMACTPDYLATVSDQPTSSGVPSPGPCHVEPVECKSDEGGPGWGRPGTDEVPYHHRVQVLQQCAVFAAPRGHLVRMAGKRFTAYVIEFDDAAQDELATWIAAGASFMASMETGVAPELDGHGATTDTLSRIYANVNEDEDAAIPDAVASFYESASDTLTAAKAEYVRAQNEIRGYLQDHRFGVRSSTGQRFVDRRVYKRRGYEVAAGMVDALYPLKRERKSGGRHAARDGVPAPEPESTVDPAPVTTATEDALSDELARLGQ